MIILVIVIIIIIVVMMMTVMLLIILNGCCAQGAGLLSKARELANSCGFLFQHWTMSIHNICKLCVYFNVGINARNMLPALLLFICCTGGFLWQGDLLWEDFLHYGIVLVRVFPLWRWFSLCGNRVKGGERGYRKTLNWCFSNQTTGAGAWRRLKSTFKQPFLIACDIHIWSRYACVYIYIYIYNIYIHTYTYTHIHTHVENNVYVWNLFIDLHQLSGYLNQRVSSLLLLHF